MFESGPRSFKTAISAVKQLSNYSADKYKSDINDTQKQPSLQASKNPRKH